MRARGWTALVAAASATLVLAAQTPQRPTFRTEANFVRVDVYPTQGGQPVTDLTKDDFEILEERVQQQIEQFEHVTIRAGGPQDARREPNTVAESRAMVTDPRARVFVLFLDTNHVEAGASRRIRGPLVNWLNRLLGPDDLIAVVTPLMTSSDITFVRRTTSIEAALDRWWGERDRLAPKDPTEEQYALCYPGIPPMTSLQKGPQQAPAPDQGIAQEMILRRRERQTLTALEELVRYLRGVREERKAIVAITDGWRLYGPNPRLARPLTDTQRGLGIRQTPQCELDRAALAQVDHQPLFRAILDEANRANASFYPIDPRGLVAFDERIVPAAGVGVGPDANPTVLPQEDSARLTARNTSLRRIAEETDGLAVVQTSDLDGGLRRIADDLSSYYLLGYYSNGKLDGKFHRVTVRVKRPGVDVRARRGYLALSAAAAAAVAAKATPEAVASPEARAIETALGALATMARELPMRVRVAAGWLPAGGAAVWVVAEPGRGSSAGGNDWTGGGQADAMLVDALGATVATARTAIPPGATSVRLELRANTLTEGAYQVTIRTRGAATLTSTAETAAIALVAAPNATSALVVHRGPTTGNKEVPTADLRFLRSDRVRIEVPAVSADPVTARLLDRRGQTIPVPVAGGLRDDADGTRWRTAELALAPLAAGDYLVELTAGSDRTLVAIRVVL